MDTIFSTNNKRNERTWAKRSDTLICVFESCDLLTLFKHFEAYFKSVWPFAILKTATKWVIVVCLKNPVNMKIDIMSSDKTKYKIVAICPEHCTVYLCTWLAYSRTYLSCGALFRKLNPETRILQSINHSRQCLSACMRPNLFPLNHLTLNGKSSCHCTRCQCIGTIKYPCENSGVDSQRKTTAAVAAVRQHEKWEREKVALKMTGGKHMFGISITDWLCFIDTKWPIVIPKLCACRLFHSSNRGFLSPKKYAIHWILNRWTFSGFGSGIITMIRHHEKHLNDDRYFEYHVV